MCEILTSSVVLVGYGNLTPKTKLGQGLTILFCLIGLPMSTLAFKTAGELIAAGIKQAVVITETRCLKREEPAHLQMKTLLSTILATIVLLLLATVSTIFLEKWSFVESLYAWFTALTTIGFGDYIQFQSLAKEVDHGETSTLTLLGYGILFMFPYLVGLSLVSSILTCIVDSVDQIRDFHDRFIKRCLSWVFKPLQMACKGSSYDVNR